MSSTGTVVAYGGSSAPSGWLLCQGQFVQQASYSALFAIIGHAYNGGTDPGDGTFKLPDLQAVYPLGKAASGTGSTLGGTGGTASHTHTGPSHTHTVSAQPGAHGTHTIGQGADHSWSHSGSTIGDHASLTHSGLSVAVHTVGQPGSHGTHASGAGAHTHDAHTGASTMQASGSNRVSGPATHASGGGHTHDAHPAHANQNVSSHTVSAQYGSHAAQSHTPSEATAHSISHANANLDTHSTHAGAAVTAGGTGASGTASPRYIVLNYLVAT